MTTPPQVLVLIAAHNEEEHIAGMIESIWNQTLPPARVLVSCDNCTDGTKEIAEAHGAETLVTVGNTGKKPGACNQGIASVLPSLNDHDMMLVIDADGVLAPGFLEHAVRTMTPEIGALGGSCYGKRTPGLVPLFQQIEYATARRVAARRKGRGHNMSGAAQFLRVRTMRAVANARGTILPGVKGDVYNTNSLTEDIELTLAIKTLGYKPFSPKAMRVDTDVMTTWKTLAQQRIRWQRGGFETLHSYGLNRVTYKLWAAYAWMYLVTLMLPMVVALWTWVFLYSSVQWLTPWLFILPIVSLDRVLLAWHSGWKGRILAGLIVPTWFYDWFRGFTYWVAVFRSIRGQEKVWV